MSVSSPTTRTSVTITALPQTVACFEFNVAADLLVVDGGATNSANNPATVLTLNSDYTVTGGGYNSQNQLQTGNVIVNASGAGNVQVGDVITIVRNIAKLQTTTFASTGLQTPLMIEADDDKNTTIEQQNGDGIMRSMRAPVQENLDWTMPNASTRASAFPFFDTNGSLTIYSFASLVAAIESGSGATPSPAHYVYAGPTSGPPALPTFRLLQSSDLTGLTGFALAGDAASSLITTATATILGRSAAGTGAIQELTVGGSLSLSAGVLDAIQALTTTSTPAFKAVYTTRTDNTYQRTETGASNSFGSAISGTTYEFVDITNSKVIWAVDASDNFYLSQLTTNGTVRTGGGNGVLTVDAFGQLTGTATNDNAAAGKVGEYGDASSGSPVSLTNSTAADTISFSLSAGDWDVWGHVYFTFAATTTSSALVAWLSTSSANYPGGTKTVGYFNAPITAASGNAMTVFAPMQRITVASGTTTVYLSCSASFGTSTLTGTGNMFRRRRR